MNKVFKVIWSEARNAYVVVSEMAKSHGTKSCSTKKLLAMLIATGVMTCASMAPAMAANPAPDDKNIAIGSGASTNTYNYNNVYGDKPITGDIAIGQNAYAWNGGYNEGQDIYIGTHEYYMDFGQGGIVFDHSKGLKSYYKVVDGSKVAGSIAIGKNSVARTGSTILGDHTYNGKIGDTEIKSTTNYMNIQPAVFSTTIGSNTYNAGTLATVTGAFSIASSKFNGSGNTNTVIYGPQNTGATIYGSMNSIESATSDSSYSGVASSVLGFANRTQNANAALIWGTGNEITNSIEAVTGVDFKKWNSMSVSDAQKDAIKAMQSNQYAGGSVMAIGGGNKADYTTYSELTGVQNKVTGTKAKAAKYDLVNGYQNTVSNASDVTVIGIKNEVTADGNKVIGDNHKVSGKDNVIFGSADQLTETTVNNAVVLGHNAKVTGEGGVALGAGSVADRANAVSVGSKGAERQIINVAAGTADTDAVNVSQLKEAVEAGNTDTHIKPGEYGVGDDNTVNMDVVDKNGNKVDTVTIKDVAKASDVGNVNNIASDIKNQDGSHTTVVNAVNNLNNKLDNKVGDLNYVEGGKGNYVTNGENTTTSIGKLDQALKDVADTANQGWNLSTNGGEASKVAPGKTVDFSGDKNIIISNDGTNVKVKLNEAIDVNTVTANTVTTGNTVMNSDGVKVGADVSLNQNGLNVGKDVSVTATAVTAGKTSISDEGVKVGDKTYISADGLNANGQHITNVKAGEADTDAVNYGQLKDTNNRINGVENQVISNSNRINQLGNRVNKVGAGAAALAALHPMDFDPDDKLTFSAGYGNYGGENAAAIGAYYRPDEKVMFSVAGTVGNGENMVNAGVSFALDRTNHVSNSRTALAREVIDLRGQLAVMGAKMAKMEKAFGMLDETKTKLFPDVPANHWAYEYIAKLAGNGYIEGYPDGNFGGDRLMTRYEFAAMLYRAIEKGAALEEKIIKEFEPELGRIRVDRISGEDGDRNKIERVRVNDTKGERDHYGNKLAK